MIDAPKVKRGYAIYLRNAEKVEKNFEKMTGNDYFCGNLQLKYFCCQPITN